MKLTKKDIERNLNKVYNNKPLDIPLAVLNGSFKKKYKTETQSAAYKKYRQSEKGKASRKKYYQSEKYKAYVQKNREKINAYRRKYYQKRKQLKEIKE